MSLKLIIAGVIGAATLTSADVLDDEIEHFNLLNKLRKEGFRCPFGQTFAPNDTPLLFDCRLWKASQLHSEDMAAQNYFSHTSKDGRSPWDRARAQGVSANGENIAAGRSDPEAVLLQWQNSDGHCVNMMNPSMRVMGVGKAFNSGSTYRYYWTQMFSSSSQISSLDQSCLNSMPSPEPTPAPVAAAPGSSCKDLTTLSECQEAIDCDAKVKKGTMKKCSKKKCKKIKDENTCTLVSHCAPKMKKNGQFKSCTNN